MKKIIYFIIFIFIFSGCLARPATKGVGLSSSSYSTNNIVKIAKKHFGKPYRYGATGPNSFDCSGFVYAVHKTVGVNIPRTSLAQSKIEGRKLSKNQLREGDMVFFDTSLKGHVNHSGIYLGAGKFIHASSGRAYSVTISDMNGWYKNKFRWGKHINANK
ncbi:C40 family peptidase [Sulfurovum sp. bin170]|uniref:C40 family peptidase n=1 Tax=Sulfurovum sp. bin170 TaxID=2695268 RepID=UPI0013E032E7|nr:C40 family peptidase [Sulfurovum sp. bin170]NEW60774.1 C40 family peptidase [Sulfurovum sp. bin170]